MNDFFAILVLYKCQLIDSDSFQSLNRALEEANCDLDVLVFDNSPCCNELRCEFVAGRMRVRYVHDETNSGVSKAYNAGAKLAEGLNKKWLLLLDQDTSFPVDAIVKYREQAASDCPVHAPVLSFVNGYISPCKYSWGRGRPMSTYTVGLNSFKGMSLLNSGLMISLALFQEVGGFNEKIPLDFSDHYFVNEIKKRYAYFNTLDLVCRHSLSCEETNLDKVLVRFKYYLIGAREYVRCNRAYFLYVIVIARTIKLSVRFKSVVFFKSFFRTIC